VEGLLEHQLLFVKLEERLQTDKMLFVLFLLLFFLLASQGVQFSLLSEEVISRELMSLSLLDPVVDIVHELMHL
jgi:hypothetical protein